MYCDPPNAADSGAFYAMCIPSIYQDLIAEPSAKEKWYAAEHRRRWEQRYNRPYPPMVAGALGVFEGITIELSGRRVGKTLAASAEPYYRRYEARRRG